MKTPDLHDDFVNLLHRKISKSSELVNTISDILKIEKDAAYRRLNGKVNFSVREMGIISRELAISIDQLVRNDENGLWLPFLLEYPLKVSSIDVVCDIIESILDQVGEIVVSPTEAGHICCSLPMEMFCLYPLLTKFMFFKWGHYFVASEEFNNFSRWEMPERINRLVEKEKIAYRFTKSYYVWDEIIIWTLAQEIYNFCRVRIITPQEKEALKKELLELLKTMELTLNGTYKHMSIDVNPDTTSFYISSVHTGFTCNYFISEEKHLMNFQTNFSFCRIDKRPESFIRLKNWMDSFRSISVLISQCGRSERKLFFDTQQDLLHKILD